MKLKNIIINSSEIKTFCEKNHIVKLAFFGSIIRDDFNDDSDIDILVDFEEGFVPGFFGLFDMQDELSALLGGRKVDLRTLEDLSRYFRDEVLNTMDIEYEARR